MSENIVKLHSLFKQEVDKYISILTISYPKYGTRKELTWLIASWELQCSEMTIRNYIKDKKLKNLKISTIAEFIVLEEIRDNIAEDKKNDKKNRQY